jgi:hypothetical protein
MTITGNGQEFFTICQYGKEITKGTGVAATKIRVGQAPRIITDTKPEFIEESYNIRMASRRVGIYERLYMNTLSSPNAGFQQLLLPFSTGLKGGVTATNTTSPSTDWLWTFTPGLTVAAGDNAPEAFTLQLGDEQQAWRVPYCMTDRITIKGKVSQDGGSAPVSLESGFFGRYIEENAFTAAQSLESCTDMNAKLAQLYVNPSWATVGATELSDALDEFTIEILTGVHPVFRGSAQNYFNKHQEGVIGYTASFVVDSALRDELLSSQQAGDLQVVRFTITGPVIGAGTPHKLTLDMGGRWEDVTARDNSDRGDNLATVALHGQYDDTGAKGLVVTLTTDVQTVY